MEQMKKDKHYSDQATQLLRQLGLEQPDEEEENRFLLGGSGYQGNSKVPADRQVYHMPPSVRTQQDRPNVMPYLGGNKGEMRPKQMPYFGDGKNAMIQVSYTAADGTLYQMGVVSPKENKGKALYNVLAGLYAVMSAEGKSGQYAKAGKASKGA
ncbi:hypothetical protein KY349_03525 [Candidatus Woesearchaeota archaeon]|nr:hypothetical protein [Candidatus Woesearchaeota archaeon]